MTKESAEKPLKESEYKYDFHHHNADTSIAYPPESENDSYLVRLPFGVKDLEPYISQRTIYHHYNDHHLSYYQKVKKFLNENKNYAGLPLEKFVLITDENPAVKEAVLNALLLRNHNIYWQSMKPGGGMQLDKKSALTGQIKKTFGSVDQFERKFIAKAMMIGIGWIWLFKTGNGLEVIRTEYLSSPVIQSSVPLFVLDVWEHAYYVDYGSMRQRYVEVFLKNLVNWEYAEKLFLES